MTINSIITATSSASDRFHNDSNLITCDRCGCVIEGESFIATLQLVKRLVDVCMTSSLDQLRALTWQELIGDEYEELTAYCALRQEGRGSR